MGYGRSEGDGQCAQEVGATVAFARVFEATSSMKSCTATYIRIER
jgi:hypothetical protein